MKSDQHSTSPRQKSKASKQLTDKTDEIEDQSVDSSQQYIIIKSKRSRKSIKPTEKTRVFLPDLLQVIDLPPELITKEILARSCYFGKYGKIKKIFVNEQYTDAKRSKKNYVAFITYENDLDVAFAIVALKGFTHHTFNCYGNYGTTRYCQQFLNEQKCTYKNCFYLHRQVDDDFISVENKEKIQPKHHVQKAKMIVSSNLRYFVEKEAKELVNKQNQQEGLVKCNCHWIDINKRRYIELPSISSTINLMIQEGNINEIQYEELKNQSNFIFRPRKKSEEKVEVEIKEEQPKQAEIKQQKVEQTIVKVQSKGKISVSELLVKKWSNKLPQKSTLSPQNHKQLEYFTKRAGQIDRKGFCNRHLFPETISLQNKKKINKSDVQQNLLSFLKGNSRGASLFEFAQNGKKVEGKKTDELIFSSLLKK